MISVDDLLSFYKKEKYEPHKNKDKRISVYYLSDDDSDDDLNKKDSDSLLKSKKDK